MQEVVRLKKFSYSSNITTMKLLVKPILVIQMLMLSMYLTAFFFVPFNFYGFTVVVVVIFKFGRAVPME